MGVVYPDLPCSVFGVTTFHDKKSKKLKKVVDIVGRPRLCGLSALTKISDRKFHRKEIYQSHMGILSFLHSMTPDPGSMTVGDVTRRIVDHLLSFAYLAWRDCEAGKDHYPLWLGVILHTVTDSYTEAHAIRRRNAPLTKPAPHVWDPADLRIHQENDLLTRLTESVVRGTHPPMTKLQLQRALESAGFRFHRSSHAAYLRTIYHARARFEMRRALPEVDGLLLRDVGKTHRASPYDIVNYSFYPTQPVGYHSLRDRIDLIKGHPRLYDRMIRECADLVLAFRDAFASETSLDKKTRLRAFLKRVYGILMITYRVTKSDGASMSGVDYVPDTRPVLALLAGVPLA